MLREGFSHVSVTLFQLTEDFIRLLGSILQSRSALAAENLFLRKQLSLWFAKTSSALKILILRATLDRLVSYDGAMFASRQQGRLRGIGIYVGYLPSLCPRRVITRPLGAVIALSHM